VSLVAIAEATAFAIGAMCPAMSAEGTGGRVEMDGMATRRHNPASWAVLDEALGLAEPALN
jgi:hypothetical protein